MTAEAVIAETGFGGDLSNTDPIDRPKDDAVDAHAQTPIERYNRNLGLVLFFIYLVFYAAFVAIVAIDYRIMGRIVFAGLNLAIVYGMALILGAFVLALVYMALARNEKSVDADASGASIDS